MSEMRCKTCGYDLRNLPEHRCPECGRTFDPGDRKTFLTKPISGRSWFIASLVGLLFLATPLIQLIWLKVLRSKYPGPQPAIGSNALLLILGLIVLQIVCVRTYKTSSDNMPWVTHPREYNAAFWISATTWGSLMLYGFLLIMKRWLFE